jgi:hypothetical protein
MASSIERQRKYREKKKEEGKEYICIWIDAKERKLINKWKKKLKHTSDNATISYILQDFGKSVTGHEITPGRIKSKKKKPVTGNKGAHLRYDVETNKKTYQLVIKLHKKGLSLKNITDHLNENNIPTLSKSKKPWQKGVVDKLVTKPPRYILS